MSVVVVKSFDIIFLDHKSIEYRVMICDSGCVKAVRSARTGKLLGRGKISYINVEENKTLLDYHLAISKDMQGGVLCVDTTQFPIVRSWVSHERQHIEATDAGLSSGLRRKDQIPVLHLS